MFPAHAFTGMRPRSVALAEGVDQVVCPLRDHGHLQGVGAHEGKTLQRGGQGLGLRLRQPALGLCALAKGGDLFLMLASLLESNALLIRPAHFQQKYGRVQSFPVGYVFTHLPDSR